MTTVSSKLFHTFTILLAKKYFPRRTDIPFPMGKVWRGAKLLFGIF